jgi:hypothetical protein
MKNKFVIIGSVLAVLFCSCKKNYLDRFPTDQYSNSSLWTSASDAAAALNGVYSKWENGIYAEGWLIRMDEGSDNAVCPYSWESYSMLGNQILLTPTNTGAGKWDYNTIQKCNWFLTNVDKTPMDESLKNRMKAEARFLRAYKYFIMSQLYGDVPLVTKNVTTSEANSFARTSKDSVLNFVLDELSATTADLPESYTGNDIGRITKGAAWALKARVELFNQKYDACIASCNNVIGKYSLFSDYGGLFRMKNEHNSEIILDVEYKEDDVPLWGLGTLPPGSAGGWYIEGPTQSLVDAYEMTNGKTIDDPTSGYDPNDPYENRDPRLSATIIVPGSLYNGKYFDPVDANSVDYYVGYAYTGYSIRKYIADLSDYKDIWNTGLNIPVIRYAEVLLTYAEAKIEANQLDNSVYDALDQVRLRAGLPAVDRAAYSSQTKLRELVRRERRVELALEGLRWYDIQRWKIGDQVMTGPALGCRTGTVDPNTGKYTPTGPNIVVEQRTFKNYLWPIPQSEIDINKSLVQNPGY